ncbi:MAG: VWA domain-containing protein [Bacillota bacterium]
MFKSKLNKLFACLVITFLLLNYLGFNSTIDPSVSAFASNNNNQKQKNGNEANENAAKVHREKAEELLNSIEFDSQYFMPNINTTDYEKANQLYLEGSEYESDELYKEAFKSYHSSWKLLTDIKNRICERNKLYSTLLNKPNDDYDGDGLYNYFEMQKFQGGIDPLNNDTDNDGLNDGEEDYDNDKLTNLREQELGTDPLTPDSDGDELNDESEVRLGTNPLNKDTDEDGISDNQEFYSQTVKDNITLVQVEIQAQGDALDKVSIKQCIDESYLLDNSARISPLIDISSEVPFEKAKIKFPVNINSIPNNDIANVKMVYFDEENLTYVPLDIQGIDIENGVVWGETNHFSLYTLFYIPNWGSVWQVPFNVGERTSNQITQFMDVMFILDSSGSMSWNDPNDYRKTAAKSFVDALVPGDRVGVITGDRAGVVDFDDEADLLQPLTTDYEAIKEAIDSIDSSGGTDIGSGVLVANKEIIDNSSENRIKVEILLTDGEGSYDYSLTEQAKQNGITIYTIGLGSSVDESLLRSIAESTGGQYFPVSSADQLPLVYDRIIEIVNDPKDSDNDGICDDVETKGMRVGSIYNRLIFTDPNNPDSDGDGLSDGEEIGAPIKLSILGVEYSYYRMFSDPNLSDTDGDLVIDYPEVKLLASKPLLKDSDNDGLNDNKEKQLGTNPNKKDTDGDGYSDKKEVDDKRLDPKIVDRIIDNGYKYELTRDEEWKGRIHIYSTVDVPLSKALRIIPGTKVFAYNEGNQLNRMALDIGGYLIVENGLTPVVFDTGLKGDDLWEEWPGIRIRSHGYARLNNVEICKAYVGFTISGDKALLDVNNLLIGNTFSPIKITSKTYGYGKEGPPIVKLNNARFFANGGSGVHVEGLANVNISNSLFDGSGIYVQGTSGANLDLKNTTVTNSKYGLYVSNYSNGKVNVEASKCSFMSNEIGILAKYTGAKISVKNSSITNNSKYGIETVKKGLVLNYSNYFNGNSIDIHSNALKEFLTSFLTSWIPLLGDYRGIGEAIYGRDFFTDDELNNLDKGLAFLCLSEVKSTTKGVKIIKSVPNLKHLEVALQLHSKYGDFIVPYIQKHGGNLIELYKNTDDTIILIAEKYGDEGVDLLIKHRKHGVEAADLILEFGDEALNKLKHIDNISYSWIREAFIPDRSFKNVNDLKKKMNAGAGNVWHHIVEQNQIQNSGFNTRTVQNLRNVIAVPHGSGSIHQKISDYYLSKNPTISTTLRVREWLVGKSFDYQFDFGISVLQKYGKVRATKNGWEFIPKL